MLNQRKIGYARFVSSTLKIATRDIQSLLIKGNVLNLVLN